MKVVQPVEGQQLGAQSAGHGCQAGYACAPRGWLGGTQLAVQAHWMLSELSKGL